MIPNGGASNTLLVDISALKGSSFAGGASARGESGDRGGPALFDQPEAGTFARATATFAKYDSARIDTDPLLDLLFPA